MLEDLKYATWQLGARLNSEGIHGLIIPQTSQIGSCYDVKQYRLLQLFEPARMPFSSLAPATSQPAYLLNDNLYFFSLVLRLNSPSPRPNP